MSVLVRQHERGPAIPGAAGLLEPLEAQRGGGRSPKAAAYHAGLDGIRALAIAAVLLYHGGVSWAGGGFLGVETFFVLSGFLITSLLVTEWRRHSTIALRAFWCRRARRLLPALFCLVAVIGIYYATTAVDRMVPGLRDDGLATLLYVGNWHQIAVGSNYFATNGPISPLQHTWSLAIEEQFYLVWPLVVLGILWLARRRAGSERGGPLVVLLVASVIGICASAADAALRLNGGKSLDRVYYGTDTRAASLLVGASLAIAFAILDLPRRAGDRDPLATGNNDSSRWSQRYIEIPGLLAVASVLAMMHFAGSNSLWLYPWGLLGLDLAVAVIIAAVVLFPHSATGRTFALRPLRAIGIISYGIYLWHFPLFLWLDTSATGLSGTPLFMFRVAATLVISLISFFLIEQPVRRRRLPSWLVRSLTPIAAGAAALALVIAASVEGSALAPATPPVITTAWLKGTDRPCEASLTDTNQYGLVPRSPTQVASDEPAWLVGHHLRWGGSTRVRFTTCPPKRVLLIGDSIAFTLGMGFMEDEQNYGVELANAAILGCGFNNRGELDSLGNWQQQYPGCSDALSQWRRDETRFHAQAVIIEMGWRDQFDWRRNGHVVHIGQPAFDAYLRRRLNQYVHTLGRGGVPILFLTVPWSDPPSMPNGSPQAAAFRIRHIEINSIVAAVAAHNPGKVKQFDIDHVIAQHGYQGTVNGKLCRFDGVHVTVYCSRLLQPEVLKAIRGMIPSGSTSSHSHQTVASSDQTRASRSRHD